MDTFRKIGIILGALLGVHKAITEILKIAK
jgi:hypothetical protein